jgi:hypothetical protein
MWYTLTMVKYLYFIIYPEMFVQVFGGIIRLPVSVVLYTIYTFKNINIYECVYTCTQSTTTTKSFGQPTTCSIHHHQKNQSGHWLQNHCTKNMYPHH